MDPLLVFFLPGIPIGFFVAAFTRGKWWDEPGSRDKETWVPVLVTFGGSFVVVVWVLYMIFHTFMGLMDFTTNSMSKIAGWWKSRKEKKTKPIRKRIATPVPMVKNGGYREQAPKPCIACGSPTSLNQDNIQVVETASDEEEKAWEAHNL